MSPDRFALAALAGLAAVLVVAGLAAVGGPEEARRQRRDEALLLSLARVARCVERLDRASYDGLPSELAADAACMSGTDAAAPLRFRREEGNGFALCAAFERPEALSARRYDRAFDPVSGCVEGHWNGPAEAEPMDQFEVVPLND